MSRRRFTLVLLVVTSVTLLTLDFRGFAPLESARSAVLGVLAPVGDFFGGVLEPVGNAWNGITGYGDLETRNRELEQRIDELEGQIASTRTAQDELDALKRSLDITYAGDIERVTARVTTQSISNYDDTIEIDKGSGSGIRQNMAVVTGAGLVGRVVQVSDSRSVVQLISQQDVQFAVKFPDRAQVGIARGASDSRTIHAEFPFETEIATDDVLVTLGGRSVYPPDIPVGTVDAINEDPGSLRKDLDVTLFANLNDLEFVSVLLWTADVEGGTG